MGAEYGQLLHAVTRQPALFTALSKAQRDMPWPESNGYAAYHPALKHISKFGLAIFHQFADEGSQTVLRTTLVHESGEHADSSRPLRTPPTDADFARGVATVLGLPYAESSLDALLSSWIQLLRGASTRADLDTHYGALKEQAKTHSKWVRLLLEHEYTRTIAKLKGSTCTNPT